MKSYTDSDEVTGNAKHLLEQVQDLDHMLYAMDGEIPHDGADRAVKNTRTNLHEAMKHLGWLASGMWRAKDQAAHHDEDDLMAGLTEIRLYFLHCRHVIWEARTLVGEPDERHCRACGVKSRVMGHLNEVISDSCAAPRPPAGKDQPRSDPEGQLRERMVAWTAALETGDVSGLNDILPSSED